MSGTYGTRSVSSSTISAAAIALLSAVTLISGCSKAAPSGGLVDSIQRTTIGSKPTVTPGQTQSVALEVTLTLEKDILNQPFLYGADLQYSSSYDKSMDLYNQSLALGHIPAYFKIAGDELQLIADNRRLYPSVVNHPDQLISRYKILSQTDTSLVVSAARSDLYLAQMVNGPTTPNARELWVRSFNFIPEGNYFLQETSIVLSDGTVCEFMESLMPTSTLAPGANFEKFQMIPDDPIGASDGPAARFRFLSGEKIFDSSKDSALAFGQHFDISPKADGTPGTIDWYVTPNIPDEDLTPVKEAVEGWNRYFRTFQGIQRNVMRFMGRLPDGVKIGDPRFNVINWDSRLVAGAAYESQASDPMTGKQSHSLIYMPAAWIKIGTDYWQNGQTSEGSAVQDLNDSSASSGLAHPRCMRDVREAAALMASGRLAKDDIAEFGVRLLKDTLFHEVGHALGLAHNFKGSLSFDRSNPKSMFSTSIMDYNDFEIELVAFNGLKGADGPALEYDRQAIDAIYNKAADIQATDPVLPACNDAEADNEAGGVDPLCIRYDIEKDPTLSVTTAYNRVTQELIDRDVTLAQAMRRVPTLVLDSVAIGAIKDKAGFDAATAKFTKSLLGSVQFYYLLGKASFARSVKTNIKSLLQFADGVLPDGYNEAQMRERAFDGVQKAIGLTDLPAGVKAAATDATTDALARLQNSPYLMGLAAADRNAEVATVQKGIDTAMTAFVQGASGLPKIRQAILAALARHPAVPYFFGNLGHVRTDYETAIVGILSDTALSTTRTTGERVAAAGALASYKGRMNGDSALESAITKLNVERASATDNASRETAEAVLGALK